MLISSYFSADYSDDREVLGNFDPYPETIFIHDNAFSGGGNKPDHEGLEAVRLALYGAEGRLPDIVWDGVSHPDRTSPEHAICVNNPPADGDSQAK